MHLVCLGVVKRILMFLMHGPRECRLSKQQLLQISEKLIFLNGKLPRKFSRQPRSLCEIDRWKATEFRQFLLYTGAIVLHCVVSKEVYDHFLTLNVAMSILLSSKDDVRNLYLDYSSQLLRYFVRKATHIYGDTIVSYNVHALIHISDDAKYFKTSLKEISAFKFEIHLRKLKNCVRNPKNPIVQIAKCTTESEKIVKKYLLKQTFAHISTKHKDSCFLTKNGKYAFVRQNRKQTLVCDIYTINKIQKAYSSALWIHSCSMFVYLKMEKDQKGSHLRSMTLKEKFYVCQMKEDKCCYQCCM
ncbi:Uncharacterised protein r2_g1432 [Pycnogonum litorale]